nr:MAG TPA: hypothetical protein [Crassvirales sp.]
MSFCYISANLLEQFIFEYRQNDMPNAKLISAFCSLSLLAKCSDTI